MKAKSWYKHKSVVVLFLFALGIIVYGERSINAGLRDVVSPLLRFATGAGRVAGDMRDIIFQSLARAEEIRRLRIRNQELEAQRAIDQDLKKQNKELRAALGRETSDIQFIYARVIGISSSRIDDFLMVDAGDQEGIKPGMMVLVAEGTVRIGTIAEIASRTALVRLISHVGEKINVYAPESRISSVAVGQGGGVFEIQVPASIPVRREEPLFSTGPPDFLVGYVEQIEKSNAGPFQIIRLSHPVSLADVRHVFIVKN